MKTKKEQKTMCSVDEEMLIWTSYRYCIGRKTYVTSLAPYIAKKYYNRLTPERRRFMANDIRQSILDILHMNHLSFTYDGSVGRDERDPLGDFLNWINENVKDGKDLYDISKITCYKDGYGSEYPKKYRVSHDVPPHSMATYDTEWNDLMVWEDLAACFDDKKYKKVTTTTGEELICFESWQHDLIPTDDGIYLRPKHWSFRKVYKEVNRYIASAETCCYITPEYIEKVEEL